MSADFPQLSCLPLATLSWSLDGWIIVAGVLCAVSASLIGNFLILRRLSLLGDAISHAVLPGLAAAFFLSGSRSSLPMFLGAALVGILTAFLTEWIRSAGRVDEGASMGVVFTSLFALGLIMIVRAADHVDLDPGCVLHGAIELTPLDTVSIAGCNVPRVVVVLSAVFMLNLAFIICLYKELKISAFDPALSTSVGIPSWVMHYLLTAMVALTAVASFESVGNILVVAMLVAPPATAYLCTDSLPVMIVLGAIVAAVSAVIGHLSAIQVPAAFGFQSTTTAGMMAVVAGVLLFAAAVFAPRHGIVPRWWRHRQLSWQILTEDILATLYRREERGATAPIPARVLDVGDPHSLPGALRKLVRRGSLRQRESGFELSTLGRQQAERLVRAHRLWESYLAHEAGVPSHRIHDRAEQLEHFTDRELREKLDRISTSGDIDPHGSPIPPER